MYLDEAASPHFECKVTHFFLKLAKQVPYKCQTEKKHTLSLPHSKKNPYLCTNKHIFN